MDKKKEFLLVLFILLGFTQAGATKDSAHCIHCHGKANPIMVSEWKASTMAAAGVNCTDCHGRAHSSKKDGDKAIMPAIKECGRCHKDQATQFHKGKHARAQEALHLPAMGKKVKKQAPEVFDRSCAVCHDEICGGGGQCDACHSGHRFSAREARKPEACLPCHMGNHPQYESYTNSRHGALYACRGLDKGAPTCATCHMSKGNHMVKTSWGFFGIRGQEPDPGHAANQKIVKKAVEKLGPILAPDSHRPNLAQWTQAREAMLDVCVQCHTKSKVKKDLEAGDRVVGRANALAAKFITATDRLKERGAIDDKAHFWLLRDKMHAQRISMYVNAFHQYPEGVLLEMIHFKRATMDLKPPNTAAKEKTNDLP